MVIDTKSVVAKLLGALPMRSLGPGRAEIDADRIIAERVEAADLIERLSTLAPVDGGMEWTPDQIEYWTKMADRVIEAGGSWADLTLHAADVLALIRDRARLTALLAAEKEVSYYANGVADLAMRHRDEAEAALAASEAARVKAVEALRTIAAMAHNKDLGRYALQINIEAALDDALTQGATP